jgi:hypothetical protein
MNTISILLCFLAVAQSWNQYNFSSITSLDNFQPSNAALTSAGLNLSSVAGSVCGIQTLQAFQVSFPK